ncbi:MAG: HlyD family efflux transporter periplasmic adaptor subunit, partial [Planctomycetota bacterium]
MNHSIFLRKFRQRELQPRLTFALACVGVCCLALSNTLFAEAPIRMVSVEGDIIGIAKFGRRAELTFGISGQITSMKVDEGDRVRKGELIAKLYDKTAESALVEASRRAASVGPLLNAKAQLSAIQQRLAAVDRANRIYERAFSPQAVRDLRESVAVATETLREQRELIDIASAAEATAKSQLSALRLLAPFDGTIVRRFKSVGEGVDLISPIYELVDDSYVRIEFFVPEDRLGEFSVGSAIRIGSTDPSSAKNHSIAAEVQFRDLSIQPVRRVIRAWTEVDRPGWIMDGTRLMIDALQEQKQVEAAADTA